MLALIKFNQGKVNSSRDSLATALFEKIKELDLRREKNQVKRQNSSTISSKIKQFESKIKDMQIKDRPFYNWLDN